MIKRLLPLASLVLFVALGSFVSAQNGLSIQNSGHQEQQKFYALRVVSEKDVLSANDSLGAPDTRYAEILPGGQLVLLMEKKLYVFLAGTEDGPRGFAFGGAIIAKEETAAFLEGWLPIVEAQGDVHRWIPIQESMLIYPGNNYRVDLVRITNTSTEPLFVDAIMGLKPEAGER